MKKATKKRVKKATKKKDKKVRKKKHYDEELGGYPLSDNEFMKWRMLEAEAKAAKLEMDMSIVMLNKIRSKIPELLQAERNVNETGTVFGKKKREFMLYAEEMCDKFSLDPKHIIIDDKVGVLRESDFLEDKSE